MTEWIQVVAKTIDEAKEQALDRLGVDEDDAEFEVLEEPKPGLFGRMRGEAKVRARVRPSHPRPKVDRRERKRKHDQASGGDGVAVAVINEVVEPAPSKDAQDSSPRPAGGGSSGRRRRTTRRSEAGTATRSELVDEASADEEVPPMDDLPDRGETADAGEVGADAARFLAGLAAAFGLSATTEVAVTGSDVEARLLGDDLGLLIGPRGATLNVIQELTRVATQKQGMRGVRLHVDVGQYRERRREALGRFTRQVAAEVVASGTARTLEPMSAPDRKVVHDVAATIAGVSTSSEGEDPFRRVVIRPA